MMRSAWVFPGQGCQFVGMSRTLFAEYQEARMVFAEASEVLGYDVPTLCFEDPDGLIDQTQYTQPCLLTAEIAALTVWRSLEDRPKPDFVAGLSLGEYAALVAADSMKFRDAVRLVSLRGVFMQEAVPIGVGATAVIIGLDTYSVERICEELTTEDELVSVANYNCPGQVTIAGHTGTVRRASKLAKEAGAKRALMLSVTAPFHTGLLLDAGRRLAGVLETTVVRDAAVPVISNVTGRAVTNSQEIKDLLIRQVSSPVLFEQSIRLMSSHGVTSFIEFGPRETLTKLIARTAPDASSSSFGA